MTQTPASGPLALVTTPPRSLSPTVTPSALCSKPFCAAQATSSAATSAPPMPQYQLPGIVFMPSLRVSRNNPLLPVMVRQPAERLLGGRRFVGAAAAPCACGGHDVVLRRENEGPVTTTARP